MERDRIETAVQALCGEDPNVVAVYLFGSQARGTATPSSDVDVAVLYRDPPEQGLQALSLPLEGELERSLRAAVQAVTLNTAPLDLVHRVLRDVHLLLERDAARRVAFEVRARNEYHDLRPYLDEYRGTHS